MLAHRAMWEVSFGPIPSGSNVLHRCDNPGCINPGHLFLGTQRDNIDDMIAKRRDRFFGHTALAENVRSNRCAANDWLAACSPDEHDLRVI